MGATAANWILSQPWAMTPDMLETMLTVAYRANDIEAVEARRGEPLANTHAVTMRDGVAMIPVCGPISRYSNMFTRVSGGVTVDTLATDLREARDNPEVKAILFSFDTPGGQASGIGELASQIREANGVKPVHGYVSNLGASGGLWLASACGTVVCAPQAIMGSMGVVWPFTKPSEKDKAATIEFVSSQSPNKRPDMETDAGRAEMQTVVDAMAQVFIEAVAGFRGIDPAKIAAKFGNGGLMVGKAAVKAGMADRLGSLESCIDDLCNSKKSGSMKINFPKFITGLMSRGVTGNVDASIIHAELEASADDTNQPEPEPVTVATNVGALAVDLMEDTASLEASIAAARASLRAEMAAELRAGRVDLYGQNAEAFLALHNDKFTPAERDNLKSAFVAASLVDVEAPVQGFSVLSGFKSSIEARTPASQTKEIVTGDAATIAAHLSAESLKTLNSAAATPDEAKAAEEAARMDVMLNSTDEGRAILASRKAK